MYRLVILTVPKRKCFMSVIILRKDDPRDLIEVLPKISYPWKERIADIRASSMEFLKNIFIAPFSPGETFILWGDVVFLYAYTKNFQTLTNDFDLLTAETIPNVVEKYFTTSEKKVQISDNLSYISNKVQEYAKQMNLGRVDLYYGDCEEVSSMSGTATGISKSIIFINSQMIKYSPIEIDFIIAHELMHIKHDDFLKRLGFSWSKSILYFIFLLSLPWICSIPLILLTNGVAALFFSSLQRRQEKQADEGALDFLQTNKGMIEFTYHELWQHLQMKYASNEELKDWCPEIPEDVIKSEITPTGNFRYDFDHPPLTERLAMALAFVPKAQMPQEI